MMDPPSRFDAVEVPANTAHILRATRLWDEESAMHAAEHPGITPVVRGRYTAGTVGGHEVPDYAREKDVDPDRETETFVQVTLEVDTWRWNGVPVTLRSGKAIGDPAQHIRVTFRRPPHEYKGWPHPTAPNALSVGFEEEHVQLEANVGSPFDSRGMNRLTLSSGVPARRARIATGTSSGSESGADFTRSGCMPYADPSPYPAWARSAGWST